MLVHDYRNNNLRRARLTRRIQLGWQIMASTTGLLCQDMFQKKILAWCSKLLTSSISSIPKTLWRKELACLYDGFYKQIPPHLLQLLSKLIWTRWNRISFRISGLWAFQNWNAQRLRLVYSFSTSKNIKISAWLFVSRSYPIRSFFCCKSNDTYHSLELFASKTLYFS